MRPLCRFAPLFTLFVSVAQGQPAPAITASPSSLAISFAAGGTLPRPQTIALTSASPTAFTVGFSATSGGAWLDVAPVRGTTAATGATPTTISVSVDPFAANFTPGVYNGTITVNQTLQIPVTLSVTTALSASPASLNFTTQAIGTTTPAPAVQTLNVTSASPIPFAAAATSTGNWLVVAPASGTTPAAATVSVNPAGLAPGSYTGSVALTSSAAASVTVPVMLTIQPPVMFTLSSASLNFQATSAVPQPPAQSVSVFSNSPVPVFATAATNSGNTWLTVSQSAAQTPLTLTVSVQAGLVTGPHSGTITLASTKGGAAVATIPISYNVAAAQAPTLLVTPDTVNVSSVQGGAPSQQVLAVSNTGGGSLPFTAQIGSQSGGTWLSLQGSSGTAAAGGSASIPFTVTPGTLKPGVYNANITVTGAGQTANALVVLTVNSAQVSPLLLSQTGLAFAAAQGGASPAQSVAVADLGNTQVSWTASASTLSGGSWLSVTPASGTSQPLPAVPPSVSVVVNPQGLPAGTYYGSVKVNSQVISVQTTVAPAGQPLSPALSTNGLIFTAVAGGANPASQQVTFNSPQAFMSTIATDDGANWLSGPSASASSASGFSVQATLATLTPGIRHGTIRLGFADGSVQTVNVLSVVAPAGTAPNNTLSALPHALFPAASGCPSVLVPQVTSLASNFAANAAQSVPITVSVVDDCGHTLANSISSSVIASFYDTSKTPGPSAKLQPDLRLTPQGNGVWAGTWTPTAATAQAQVAVVALGINGTTPIAGQSILNGTVRAAGAGAPALPSGIFNAASYQPGNTVALGSFVSIFGSNLSNGASAPSTQPLPTNYQGTQVFLGGVALPLQYAGSNQINALIPANVAVDTQQPLVVQRDLTQAAPTTVAIADAQPGIYTANQQGSGQGAVLNSDYSYNGTRPTTRGDYIQIYCTGLGGVTNPPAAGAAAPNAPLSYTVSPVTVSIGGVNAPVLFAGLAPGFIGLYQVNATVPLGGQTGPSVPITISVGDATSNVATIAVQ